MDSRRLALVLVLCLVVFLEEGEALSTGLPKGTVTNGKREVLMKVRNAITIYSFNIKAMFNNILLPK